jgi:hypothetical protein
MTQELTLTFARAGSLAAPEPVLADPRTQVWKDAAGADAAYFYTVDSEYWAWMRCIGTFQIQTNGEILVEPDPSASRPLVIDWYRRAIAPMALQLFGMQVVHASAVLTAGGVVGFCAHSQTGKSTLAYGFGRQGYELWADDALAFDVVDGDARALPFPCSIRLRPESASYFGVGRRLDPPELGPDSRISVGGPGEPLAGICLLTRRPSGDRGPVAIRRLTALEIVPRLLPQAYCFTLLGEERKRRTLETYLALTASVPVYEVRFAVALDELPELMAAIETTVFRKSLAA